MTLVAASVSLFFALVLPPQGGPVVRAVTIVLPGVLALLALALHRASDRKLFALWAPTPIVGILVIAGLDLATSDASAAGQVFLCYPVIYAASQLKAPAAVTAAAVAVAADATVVLSLEPLTAALTDLGYVTAALVAATALLLRAGRRHDALVDELRRQAAIDPLTGLVTRRVLDEAVQSALTSADDGSGTGLVLLDVDKFKTVNDKLGHPVGDAALVHIAQLLARHTRPDTVVCRMGGDEIAFLMPGCPVDVATRRAEEIVDIIKRNPLILDDGTALMISVSAGVAHAPRHANNLRELYAEADAALYTAKRAGRGRVGVPALAS